MKLHRCIRLLACASLLVAAAHGAALAQSVQRGGDTILLQGRITREAAAEFLKLVAEPGAKRLVIDSRGGLVDPALDIAEAVLAHGLDVEVPRQCLSSCANYIFPAGRNKVLGWPGAVGWHGNMHHILWTVQTGQATYPDAAMADARRLVQREEAFYARVGMDEFICWFGKLAPYGAQDFYYVSTDDMLRFGIHGVRIMDKPPVSIEGAVLRAVTVDWDHLDAIRPVVHVPPSLPR